MNNEPIIGNSNGEGICTVENPYYCESLSNYTCFELPEASICKGCVQSDSFDQQHPSLSLYDTNNNLVRDAVGVRVIGPVWQFKSTDWHGWKNTDKTTYVRFEVYEQFADYYKKQGYDTRRIYLLAEAQKDSEEKKVSNGFWWCWECQCEVDAHNVTNEEKHDNCGADVDWCLVDTAPLSDKLDVEERALDSINLIAMAKRSWHGYKDEEKRNSRLIGGLDESHFNTGYMNGFFDGKRLGATDQEKLMQGEWVKVSEVEAIINSCDVLFENQKETILTILRNKQQ